MVSIDVAMKQSERDALVAYVTDKLRHAAREPDSFSMRQIAEYVTALEALHKLWPTEGERREMRDCMSGSIIPRRDDEGDKAYFDRVWGDSRQHKCVP